MEIDPDRAVPFGLLVNELATNAIKHAFPDGTGRVVLSVEQVGDQIELTVADDGVGMKDKDSVKIPEKRGSDYVAIFVRQLGGTIVPSSLGRQLERPSEYAFPCFWPQPEAPSAVAA